MSSTITCADSEFDPSTLTVEKTLQLIQDNITPLKTVQLLHIRDALGYVLARDVISPMQVPPHRNSAMDGYAFNHDELQISAPQLAVIGISLAGKPCHSIVKSGTCVRIMTGAVMPEGADTVVMQEHVSIDNDRITINKIPSKGQNVRYPGEDIQTGDKILHSGKQLSPADLGLLSSIGVNEVHVFRKPVVAFFSTGDELKGVGEMLGDGDIYDSNRYTLYGMLKNMDVELLDMGVIRDEREALKDCLLQAAENADMIISSGGASVGDADYVTDILNEIGKVNFWKIAMKPGKPLAFGTIYNTPYFGLPGNPVSVMATCYLFVQPAIQRLKGIVEQSTITLRARLQSNIKKTPGRKDYQRGIYSTTEDGELVVTTTGVQGSHILTSMSRANCFIVIPLESANLVQGEIVEIMPFNGIL